LFADELQNTDPKLRDMFFGTKPQQATVCVKSANAESRNSR
jgi:hypothetical protein